MEELIKKVQEWANNKGLNKPEQLKVQALKVLEEMGEMNAALLRINKPAEKFIQMPKLIDGLGDLQVTLIVLSGMKGIDYTQIETTSLADSFDKEDAYDWALNIASWFMASLDEEITDTRFCFFFSAIKGAIIELCKKFDLSPEQCLATAYDEIKGRTGQLVNGTFIKDEVLQVPIHKKPNPVDYGWCDNAGFDSEPSFWAIEEGEEEYNKALKLWELSQQTN